MASSEHHHHQHCHCHDGVCVGAHMMGPATGEGGVAATESRDHSQTSARCSTNVAPPMHCNVARHPPTFTCLAFISSSIVMPPTNQRLPNKIPKTISISAIILTIGRCGPASFFSHISSYYRAIVSREGSTLAKSARQPAVALFSQRRSPTLPLCASVSEQRWGHLGAIGWSPLPSSVKAIPEDCGIQLHIVGITNTHTSQCNASHIQFAENYTSRYVSIALHMFCLIAELYS